MAVISAECQSPVSTPDYRRLLKTRTDAVKERPTGMDWTKEPVLSELLGDPIVRALMVADRVEEYDLDALIARVKCQLRWRGPACAGGQGFVPRSGEGADG